MKKTARLVALAILSVGSLALASCASSASCCGTGGSCCKGGAAHDHAGHGHGAGYHVSK